MRITRFIATCIITFATSFGAGATPADVEKASARKNAVGKWSISATVSHADEGWDHYADFWEVVAPDGTVLARRILAHPHVDEQPFTRSKGSITIPDDVTEVIVRAGHKDEEKFGKTVTIKLDR